MDELAFGALTVVTVVCISLWIGSDASVTPVRNMIIFLVLVTSWMLFALFVTRKGKHSK